MAGAAWRKAAIAFESSGDRARGVSPCGAVEPAAGEPAAVPDATDVLHGPAARPACARTPGRNQSPKPSRPRSNRKALRRCRRWMAVTSCRSAPRWKSRRTYSSASSPAGLAVKVHVPQEVEPSTAKRSRSADVKDTTVDAPRRRRDNPAGANGLEACTGTPEAAVLTGVRSALRAIRSAIRARASSEYPGDDGDLHGKAAGELRLAPSEQLEPGVNFCPDASKIGTVKITVPVLANPLEGSVYLAAQNCQPVRVADRDVHRRRRPGLRACSSSSRGSQLCNGRAK